jgi:hypothetical protein
VNLIDFQRELSKKLVLEERGKYCSSESRLLLDLLWFSAHLSGTTSVQRLEGSDSARPANVKPIVHLPSSVVPHSRSGVGVNGSHSLSGRRMCCYVVPEKPTPCLSQPLQVHSIAQLLKLKEFASRIVKLETSYPPSPELNLGDHRLLLGRGYSGVQPTASGSFSAVDPSFGSLSRFELQSNCFSAILSCMFYCHVIIWNGNIEMY